MNTNAKTKVDVLITHGLILTMDDRNTFIEDGAVAIQKDRLLALGKSEDILDRYFADEVIKANDHLVIPGLINAHTHGSDSLFRGLVEDLPLEPWLERLWKPEAKFSTAENVFWGAKLAYLEMIRSGITTALDMFWFPEALAEAALQVGFRLVTGPIFFDTISTDGIPAERRVELALPFMERFQDHDSIVPCLQPHAVYTVSPTRLQQVLDLAQQTKALIHTHASETETEVNNSLREFGHTPIKHLDNLGLLTSKTVLAHCVHLKEEEIELLALRGTSVAHCPISNLKLASGVAPVHPMLQSGVNVAFGTDGPVSGNDLNPWITMRLGAILQKNHYRNPRVLPAREVVAMFTCKAAKALGLGDQIGSLEPGKKADVVLIKLNQLHSLPSFDWYTLLVYSIGRDDVDTVLINGKVVMREYKFTQTDENTVIENIQRINREIIEFMASESA